MMKQAFKDLPLFYFDAIIADPPWHFSTYSQHGQAKSPSAHYSTMSIGDICALPVNQLARNDCLLMLWITAPHLQYGFKVIEAWGFTYKTCGAWIKTTTNNKLAFGTGYILRSCAEFYIIASMGKPILEAKNIRNAFLAERREHSRKPDEQYDIIESLMPNKQYCELFSRTNRNGWHSWGNEAGRFTTTLADQN